MSNAQPTPGETYVRRWLVTVIGEPSYVPAVQATFVVLLEEPQTPVHWFLSRPTVFYKSEFIPRSLSNFWPIDNAPVFVEGFTSPLAYSMVEQGACTDLNNIQDWYTIYGPTGHSTQEDDEEGSDEDDEN